MNKSSAWLAVAGVGMVFALGCQDITSPEVEPPNLSHAGHWKENVECWDELIVDEINGGTLAGFQVKCSGEWVWVEGPSHSPIPPPDPDPDPWDDEGGGEGGEGGDDGGPTDEEEEGCLLIGVTLQPDQVRPGAPTTVVVQISSTGPAPWVLFSATAVASSGGHSHTGGRPLGQFGTTGGQVLQTTYTASPFGGAETIHVAACDATASAGLTVDVSWLGRLGGGTGYILGGDNTIHPANHYGTAAANIALRNTGTWYDTQYPGSRLYYNDQSLVRGGWFDINGAWTGAHDTHREGKHTDIQRTGTLGPPAERWSAVQNQLALEFSDVQIHGGGSHWHVREN